MSIFGFGQVSDWPSSPRPRFAMRRDRVLPGPLKSLPRRPRVSVRVAFAIVLGAFLATGAVVAAIPDRVSTPPERNASVAFLGNTEAAGAASSVVTDLTPRKIATREPAMTVAATTVGMLDLTKSEAATPETVMSGSRHDEAAPSRHVAAARTVTVAASETSTSPFRLDQLPVLSEDGSSFTSDRGSVDIAAAPPIRTALGQGASRGAAPRDPPTEFLRMPQP